ncbi:MAG: hypothetical protein EXS14_03245 [Planctomycetes bacterium]|nr:hypothetical protein [Planctomycetota bacterium]
MNSQSSALAMAGGGLAALLVLVCSWSEQGPVSSLGDPLVGRSLDSADTTSRSLLDPELRPAEDIRRSRVAVALEAQLPALLAAPTFDKVVLHGLDAAPPAVHEEEGPAWHVVLDTLGAIEVTPRARVGRAGSPLGSNAQQATAIHVLLPEAAQFGAARQRSLGDLLRQLLRRVRRGPEALSISGVPVALGAGWWP